MSGLARVVATLFVVLSCAVATACGGSDAAGGSGSVRLLVFGDPAEIKAYRELIAAFGKQKQDVAVQLVEASDRADLVARLATSFAGGTPPDLFLINYRFYGQFASKGVLEPLGKWLGESEAFEVDDFYQQAIDAFRWDGELTCLPQNVSSLVVYYNRDLFRRFGVPEPSAGMGWHEFVFKARQLTRDAQGNPVRGADPDLPSAGATVSAEIYGLGVEPTIIRIAPFIWSNRGELVDSEERPTRFTLDSPAAKVALQEFFDLRRLYGVVPSDTDVQAEDDETRFVNGRLGMLLDSRRLTPTLREAAKFDWDVAPLPILGEPAGILHSDAYCMAKASENKDAAWRFVEFALGPEGERVLARTGRTVPSLKSVAQSVDFLDPDARPRSSRVFLDGIQNIRRVPTVSTWPEIEDAAEGILEHGMYLGQPVDKVVEELDRATRPLFARGER